MVGDISPSFYMVYLDPHCMKEILIYKKVLSPSLFTKGINMGMFEKEENVGNFPLNSQVVGFELKVPCILIGNTFY